MKNQLLAIGEAGLLTTLAVNTFSETGISANLQTYIDGTTSKGWDSGNDMWLIGCFCIQVVVVAVNVKILLATYSHSFASLFL